MLGVALLLVLGGCGWTTYYRFADDWLGYQARRYLDLSDDQALALGASIDALHAEHRRHALPDYAGWVRAARAAVAAGLDEPAARRLYDGLRTRMQDLLLQAVPGLASLAPQLDDAQLDHLAAQLAKDQEELDDKYVTPPPAERLADRAQRIVEWIERFAGRLTPDQRARIAAANAELPSLAGEWLAHRARRQQALLELLRTRRAQADIGPALRQWIGAAESDMEPGYRRERERLETGLLRLVVAALADLEAAQRARVLERLDALAAELDAEARR